MPRIAAAARAVSVWAITGAMAASVLALSIDGALLASACGPLAAIAAAIAAAPALAVVVALAAAPAVAAMHWLAQWIARRPSGGRHIWPAPLAFFAFALAWFVTEPTTRHAADFYVVCCVLYAVAVALVACGVTLVAYLRTVLALAALAGALAVDLWLPASLYIEFHNLFHVLAVMALAVLLTPWRRRLAAGSPGRLAGALAAMAACAMAILVAVEIAAPGWRWMSLQHGLHGSRMARALRAVADLDRDGYSPIAWGTDCDDLDRGRHPLAGDTPGGGDQNCNGVDPPAQPTAGDRGLAPPRGNPAVATGKVDRVVLITLESTRWDAVHPELMPNLSALARRGIAMERMYAASSRTRISLALIFRATGGAPHLVTQLAEAGIAASAVIPNTATIRRYSAEFAHRSRAPLAADAITKVALERMRALAGQRHFVWIHYFEPHYPYEMHEGVSLPEDASGLPPDRAYQSEVATVDAALGRLIAALEADPRWARTVLIITGDHGQALGEHGEYGHARTGWDEILRVPGVIVGPGLSPMRYRELASHRDLPATMLGAFGLTQEALAAERAGRSWWRLRAAPSAPLHEFVVARSGQYASGVRATVPIGILVEPRYKLIVGFEDHVMALYDLHSDPGELSDRASLEPHVAETLWRRLALYADIDGYPRGR